MLRPMQILRAMSSSGTTFMAPLEEYDSSSLPLEQNCSPYCFWEQIPACSQRPHLQSDVMQWQQWAALGALHWGQLMLGSSWDTPGPPPLPKAERVSALHPKAGQLQKSGSSSVPSPWPPSFSTAHVALDTPTLTIYLQQPGRHFCSLLPLPGSLHVQPGKPAAGWGRSCRPWGGGRTASPQDDFSCIPVSLATSRTHK